MGILKHWVMKSAKSLGFELIPTWRFKDYALTECLKFIFQRQAINCILDVGANRGQYGLYLRQQVGYTGKIISFEPTSECFLELQKISQKDKNWEVHQFALGSVEQICQINVMHQDQLSSFLVPNHSQINDYKKMNIVNRTEDVSIKRLDDILKEIGVDITSAHLYLKMDTQGFDMEVLSGAKASLPYIRALQSEVSVLNIYKNMPSMDTVINFVRSQSFDLAGLFPVNLDKRHRVVEFDAVFMNKGYLALDLDVN